MVQELPTKKCDRVVGEYYMYKKELRYWNGKKLLCGEHKKRKNYCIVCGGSSLCEHGKEKSRCVKCGGSSLCEHGKRKDKCVKCGGTGICKHGKRKEQCVKCGGTDICKHGKRKYRCKQCGGSSICEHGRDKFSCKQCDGGGICEHNQYKAFCKKCGGSALCKICKLVIGKKRYISKTDTFMLSCIDCFHNKYPDEPNIPRRFKRKQHYIHDKLTQIFGEDFFEYDKTIECGCSRRMPDWFRDCYNHVVIIECDENQHRSEDPNCELKRINQLFEDINYRPCICIRFNPDKYKENGVFHKGCFGFDHKNNIIVNEDEFERRFTILQERIDYYLQNGTEKGVHIEKLFYTTEQQIA